jgi:biotin operon repressor
MSIHWMSWVWDNSPYKGSNLLLHLALADFADDQGNLFASQPVLAEKARCTPEYIRRAMKQLSEDGYVEMIKRGNSKGRATTYKMWGRFGFKTQEPPNKVGESDLGESTPQLYDDSELNPQLLEVNPPTLTPQPPNSHSIPTVLYNCPNTTYAIAKTIAKNFWDKQEIKPLGKKAYWSLLEVCKAALKNGYSAYEIKFTLDKLGIVPNMALMDSALKRNMKEAREIDRSRKDREIAIEATRRHLEAVSDPEAVPMPEDVKMALRKAGLLRT